MEGNHGEGEDREDKVGEPGKVVTSGHTNVVGTDPLAAGDKRDKF